MPLDGKKNNPVSPQLLIDDPSLPYLDNLLDFTDLLHRISWQPGKHYVLQKDSSKYF